MSSATGGNGASAKPKSTEPAERPASRAPTRDDADYWNVRTWRELWLSQLSELSEQYMRSPAFLTWLRCTIVLENTRLRWLAQLSPGPASVVASFTAPSEHRGENVR